MECAHGRASRCHFSNSLQRVDDESGQPETVRAAETMQPRATEGNASDPNAGRANISYCTRFQNFRPYDHENSSANSTTEG
jgi:hypothetical protein